MRLFFFLYKPNPLRQKMLRYTAVELLNTRLSAVIRHLKNAPDSHQMHLLSIFNHS